MRNIIDRLFIPPKKTELFLFGVRDTGKTTFLEKQYKLLLSSSEKILNIVLLDPDQEEIFSLNPNRLKELLLENKSNVEKVIVDEIKKIPRLLDFVHFRIQAYFEIFV